MSLEDLNLAAKQAIRQRALAGRRHQLDKDGVSRLILARMKNLSPFAAARTVLCYIDVRDEVRTRQDVVEMLTGPQRIVVPYCVGSELELFHLRGWDELQRGRFGILEPAEGLRSQTARRVPVSEVDFAAVPGVAFDRRGARIGHGHGFFDRLLARVRRDTWLVGLAYACQVVDEIPLAPHDVIMHQVVTEQGVLEGTR